MQENLKKLYYHGDQLLKTDKDLVTSKAYASLTGASHFVYSLFCLKLKWKRIKVNGKKDWCCLNPQEIIFPYRDAEKHFGITPKRFTTAIDQLVEHGLLDIVAEGVPTARIPTVYGISTRWKLYGSDGFVCKSRVKGMHTGFCKSRVANIECSINAVGEQ